MPDGPPLVFDTDAIEEALVAHDVDEADVIEGLDAVQVVVTGFGELSVDDLVYEWRTRHHKDPLVHRTPDAYYLDVREHVWSDVVDRSTIESATVVDAVKAVHAAQFSADRGGDAPEGAMVLERQERRPEAEG